MSEQPSTLFMDDSTRASNPGGVTVQKSVWLRYYPKWPLILGGLLLVSVVLWLTVHWAFFFAALVMLLVNRLYWRSTTERMTFGCTNPGFVVAADPTLIAVMTDLSKGLGDYPVVKIIRQDVPDLPKRPVKVGRKVATVAVYKPTADDIPHWAGFEPRPVECTTGNLSQIKRSLQSVAAEDWEELKQALRHVPKPYTPGTYPIGWKGEGLH